MPFTVAVHVGDAQSIIEALDAIESQASILHSNPYKTYIQVDNNEGDAKNVLGQFGYDDFVEVPS
jgi:hypothetical protein